MTKKPIPRRKFVSIIVGSAMIAGGGVFGAKTIYDFTAPSAEDSNLQASARSLENQWGEKAEATPHTEPIPEPTSYENGQTIGILKIPAWGPDHAVPIIHGTTQENLEHGVGHYEQSARAGQEGNFAVAGHRSGDPQPFRELLDVKVGDEVIVETEAATYVYVVTKNANETTVKAEDGGWAIVQPEVEGDNPHTLTLTTCTHLYRSLDRSILFGELKSVEHKVQTVSQKTED